MSKGSNTSQLWTRSKRKRKTKETKTEDELDGNFHISYVRSTRYGILSLILL